MQMGKPPVEDPHRAKRRLGQRMDGPERTGTTDYGAYLRHYQRGRPNNETPISGFRASC